MDSGIPAHISSEKTRTEVKTLASFGVTQEEISTYIGIDAKTLRKHYRTELDKASLDANAVVARRLYTAAVVEGSVAAMIFWLKTRARWSEKLEVDLNVQAAPRFDPEDRDV